MIKSEVSDFKEALRLHQNNLQILKKIDPKNYNSYN